MMARNEHIKEYLSEVRQKLDCYGIEKYGIISEIRTRLDEYQKSKNGSPVTKEEIYNEFGSPTELLAEFPPNVNSELKKLGRKIVLLRVITIVSLVLFLTIAAFLIAAIADGTLFGKIIVTNSWD